MTFQPVRTNPAVDKGFKIFNKKLTAAQLISWGYEFIPGHTGNEKLYLSGKGRVRNKAFH